MTPVIAIVGRPNVGKSTLFNYLTRSRAALVADQPGVTRDRQYGQGEFESKHFILIDTGGIEENIRKMGTGEALQALMQAQTVAALQEADMIFWVVDARAGLTSADQAIVEQLRPLQKPIYILVNKTDGLDPQVAVADFYSLGFGTIYPIAASQGRGVKSVMDVALSECPAEVVEAFEGGEESEEADQQKAPEDIRVAIIGKPNVGKSTLVNRILGEERVIVFDAPGTTRDSIFIPFERRGQHYTLIDTAGVRRKRSIDSALEQFSVVKTLQAIADANVVVFVISAREGVTEQDMHILGFIIESGRSLIIAVNKWDGLSQDEKSEVKRSLDRRLQFVDYARIQHISALHGTGVGDLFPLIKEAYRSATRQLSTSRLTDILEKALEAHQPPAVIGRRIKLRYAHPGGSNPPVVVIHGNQTDRLPESYRRYLENYYRDYLNLVGTPVRIVFKTGENPYKDKKNELTDRQKTRRKRLIQHVKKKT